MFCKKCGYELSNGSRFCPKCGCEVTIVVNADIDVDAEFSYSKNVTTDLSVDTTIMNNRSMTNTADVDVSSSNVEYTTVNNYNTANHFERRGPGVADVAAHAVKKSHSALKTTAIIAILIAVLVSAGSIYVEYFVSGPEATISKMVDAMNQLDLNTAVECFCPKVVGEYKAMLGVGNVLLGLSGLPGDMNALSGLAPLMGYEYGFPEMKYEIKEVEYSGGSFEAFPIKINGIGKLLASDAYVTLEEYEKGKSIGEETIHLKKYGKDGWLIEDDLFK